MKYLLLTLCLFCLVTLSSCSTKDNPVEPKPTDTGMSVVGEQTSNGIKVQLLAADTIETGYNKLYIKLTNVATGAIIRNAHVSVTPIMDMGTHTHSTPVEQPNSTASGDVFPTGIMFIMPNVDMDKWTVDISVQMDGNEQVTTVHIPVEVSDSDRVRVITGSDGVDYVVSMGCLCGASVGLNDIEFTVHREDMMSFLPVEDLTPVMTPDMPSMGHGSPNNVNPVHTTLGHYEGKVNFTMRGEWRITLELKRATESIGTVSFTTTL